MLFIVGVNVIISSSKSRIPYIHVNSRENDQKGSTKIIPLLVRDMFLLIPQRALDGFREVNCEITKRRLSFDFIRSRYVYVLAAKVTVLLFGDARISPSDTHVHPYHNI